MSVVPTQSLPGRPTAEPAPDVVVVGGGVIGCSVAYHLSLAGQRVLVLERNHLAAGASGVAAGMLAPQVEAVVYDPFFDVAVDGRAEHGPLSQQLFEDVGLDVEWRATGILRVALTEAERADLQRQLRWQTVQGLRAEWVESRDLGRYEPLLAGVAGRVLAGGVWFPDEAQVRSPRLVQALAAASVKRGARFAEGTWALGFERAGPRVTGVRTPTGVVQAGTVVLAAGVWTRDLLQSVDLALPIGPVKGQIITLRALQTAPRSIIWSGECYLVPKVDGEVVLGATVEDGAYDARPSLAGVGALTEAALELLPVVGRYTLVGVWAGLRPAAPDRLPIIGWAPGVEGLYLATAHFRNGVLLGPLTGRWVTETLVSGTTPPALAAFAPERFLAAAPLGGVSPDRERHGREVG